MSRKQCQNGAKMRRKNSKRERKLAMRAEQRAMAAFHRVDKSAAMARHMGELVPPASTPSIDLPLTARQIAARKGAETRKRNAAAKL